jgi:hypothetical protein
MGFDLSNLFNQVDRVAPAEISRQFATEQAIQQCLMIMAKFGFHGFPLVMASRSAVASIASNWRLAPCRALR